MKKIYAWTLANSFLVAIGVALVAFVAIVFGSLSYTAMKQMAMIMAVFYLLCRAYQSYRKCFDPTYSLLGGHNLEKLFLILSIFSIGVGLYIDACKVARL